MFVFDGKDQRKRNANVKCEQSLIRLLKNSRSLRS